MNKICHHSGPGRGAFDWRQKLPEESQVPTDSFGPGLRLIAGLLLNRGCELLLLALLAGAGHVGDATDQFWFWCSASAEIGLGFSVDL